MRLQFRTLTRPKRLAQQLQILFPALKHMQAQEWAARVLGYRDWHELASCSGPKAKESPDPFGLNGGLDLGALQDSYDRRRDHEKALAALAGAPGQDMERLMDALEPTAVLRGELDHIGNPGRGTPCFEGMGWNLFGAQGEAPGMGGGMVVEVGLLEYTPSQHIYCGIPQNLTPDAFTARLLSYIQPRQPYRSYTEEAGRSLATGVYGCTVFCRDEPDDDLTVAGQSFRRRYFLMENGEPIGFVVLQAHVWVAQDSQDMTLMLQVDDAWWPAQSKDVLEALQVAVYNEFEWPLLRLNWFGVANPEASLHVCFTTESESQQAQSLVSTMAAAIPAMLGDAYATTHLASRRFSADICP